jgi:tRNA (cmo5U34)-methyltransferase
MKKTMPVNGPKDTDGPAEGDGTPADRIFATPRPKAEDFNFGAETTAVFDDMVDRSVPYYAEIQRMVAELAGDFAIDGTNVYDLGCSTGTTFLRLDETIPADRHVTCIGLDNSTAMLEKAKRKLEAHGFKREHQLRCADLNKAIDLENASVVILNLTLQFIRPLYRDQLIAAIYRGMVPNGCLIVVEKVLGESSTFNRLFIQHYYEMKKRHGYTEMEIAQKREALENVLIPYRLKENEELLQRAGFQHVDVFFKWYNFCGIIAIK